MTGALAIRFLAGGALVSLFSLCGDLLKPRSLAGIFSASPAVLLLVLGLVRLEHTSTSHDLHGKSLVVGAASLTVYCLLTAYLVRRGGAAAWLSPLLGWAQWLAMSFGLWLVFW